MHLEVRFFLSNCDLVSMASAGATIVAVVAAVVACGMPSIAPAISHPLDERA
jgi:hypothetical protein